jgi:hypothetical protein
MKTPLVNQKQPFGNVHNVNAHPGDAYPAPTRNPLADGTQVMNNGATMHPSFADKNPNAQVQASRNGHQPFAPVHENFGEFK